MRERWSCPARRALLTRMTTDELIALYAGTTLIPRAELEAAIPAAIDALYAARDDGKVMHDAGAAAAVAALLAAIEPRRKEAS